MLLCEQENKAYCFGNRTAAIVYCQLYYSAIPTTTSTAKSTTQNIIFLSEMIRIILPQYNKLYTKLIYVSCNN